MTEQVNNQEAVIAAEEGNESSLLNVQFLLKTFVLNWQWFVLSVIICVGIAAIYVRYATPAYQVKAKVLIKDDDNQSRGRNANQIMNTATLGIMNSSDGFDNELEVLKSRSIAEGAVRDLKLYVEYTTDGRVKDVPIYQSNPIIVDMDAEVVI